MRLRWFVETGVPFAVERKLEISYTPSTAERDFLELRPTTRYVFTGLANPVPATDIIVFEDDLPSSYARTQGSVGNKFATDPQEDPVVKAKDRIVEVERGKETIRREPPEFPDPRIKEVEIREREDVVRRKLVVENEGSDPVVSLEVRLVSTRDVRFVEASPAPDASEPPEYSWKFQVPAEGATTLELKLKTLVKKTFRIEREREREAGGPPESVAVQRARGPQINASVEQQWDEEM